MKNKIYMVFLTLFLVGWKVPEDPTQIVVNDSNWGQLTIYIPTDYTACIAFVGDTPVSTCYDQFRGVFTYGNTEYLLYFEEYTTPYYYYYPSGSYNRQQRDLSVNELVSTNLRGYQYSDYTLGSYKNYIICGGIILVLALWLLK